MTEDPASKLLEKHRNKEDLHQLLLDLHKELKGIPEEVLRRISVQFKIPLREIRENHETAILEHEFLKGLRDPSLGVYSDLFSAKSSIKGQDGGVTTSLLISGIEKGIFDVAVVVQQKKGYDAEAVVAENIDQIMAARGTKYVRAKTIPKLRELILRGKKKRIAIVGTPCEIQRARKLQQAVKLGESDAEITTIGLFCLEAFNHKKLKEETKRLLGIDISKAEKIQIRKGRFTVHVDGKKYSCKTKELANAVEKRCHYCDDFSARLADISVGTVGSPNGYSTIVVRSDVGRRLLDNLDIVRVEAEKEEVRRLSKFKRERAGKNFSRLESETSRKPQGL